MPVVTSAFGKSSGKLWWLATVLKAVNQISPQAGASSCWYSRNVKFMVFLFMIGLRLVSKRQVDSVLTKVVIKKQQMLFSFQSILLGQKCIPLG